MLTLLQSPSSLTGKFTGWHYPACTLALLLAQGTMTACQHQKCCPAVAWLGLLQQHCENSLLIGARLAAMSSDDGLGRLLSLSAGGPAMAAASRAAFAAAAARLESIGGQRVEIDFSPFAEAAALLYQSSFVAERYSGIRAFLDKPSGGPAQQPEAALQQQRSLNDDQRLLPVTRAIISGSGAAAQVFCGSKVARAQQMRVCE
jgi:hypothetical protein